MKRNAEREAKSGRKDNHDLKEVWRERVREPETEIRYGEGRREGQRNVRLKREERERKAGRQRRMERGQETRERKGEKQAGREAGRETRRQVGWERNFL